MKRISILLLALAVAAAALGHEFWLEPARFFVLPGATVHVRRYVGQNFRGTAWAGKRQRLLRLTHYAPGAPAQELLPAPPAAGSAADTIRSVVTFRQPGTHLLALATTDALITLPPDTFAAYLREEGLEYVLAQRKQRGETGKPGREAYRRCAKTLVQAGPASPTDTARAWSRPVGLALELVPDQNPYLLPAGAAFTVRVLAAGRPLPGQLVLLWRRGARPNAVVSKLRSNQNGRVLFRVVEPGEYLVSTVRMVAAPANQSAADWHSTWSTLTFGFRGQKRP